MPSEPRRPASAEPPADDQLLAFVDSILAQSTAASAERAAESRACLTFVLGESRFATPLERCREIARLGEITRVPDAPGTVRGVVNLRGRVVPALDLHLRVGLEPATLTPQSRLVVAEARGRLFGLLVDRVLGINKIPVTDIEVPPKQAPGEILAGRVHSGGDVVLLLDPDAILSPAQGGKP